MAAPSRSETNDILPRAKVWLERDGRYVFGLGISNILKAVARTGSIKQAAKKVGKSYRHVCSRIKQVERDLGESLVETKVGGNDPQRSELTDTARQLIARFDDLRDRDRPRSSSFRAKPMQFVEIFKTKQGDTARLVGGTK